MTVEPFHIEGESRFQEWLDFLERCVIRYNLNEESYRSDNFAVEANGRAADSWRIGRIQTRGGRCELVRRSEEITADDNDNYMLYLPLRSSIGLQQFGRSADCTRGSFGLISCGEKLVHSKSGDNDTVYFGIPRRFVERRLRDPDRHCAGAVSATSGLGGLAVQALLALEQQASDIPDEQLPAAAAAVGDLLMLALERQGDLLSGNSTVRAGNLARAKRIIRSRLADAELTPSVVAKSCGISLSYLHNLFRDDGRTMCEFLLAERLGRARSLLAHGQVSTVTEAALDCGFSNMSSFSTAFRAAFGMPPREVLHSGQLN